MDEVHRAWKSGLARYAEAYAEASDLMLGSLEAAVANSLFGGSGAVVVPQLRSTDTVLNEDSFASKTAEAVARGAGGRVVALLSRSSKGVPAAASTGPTTRKLGDLREPEGPSRRRGQEFLVPTTTPVLGRRTACRGTTSSMRSKT